MAARDAVQKLGIQLRVGVHTGSVLLGGGVDSGGTIRGIAVNIAPSDSKRVYAFVESPQSALYVSDDGGATWEARDRSQWMV